MPSPYVLPKSGRTLSALSICGDGRGNIIAPATPPVARRMLAEVKAWPMLLAEVCGPAAWPLSTTDNRQ